MRINLFKKKVNTLEGAPATNPGPEKELRRTLMACMLWEDQFYEDGIAIADRIASLIPQVNPQTVADLAIEAREKMKLRHAPLLVVREMAHLPEHKKLVEETLFRVIQRADELAEFVAIYWKDKKQPLSAQVKRGLARAFVKFNAYELAKYNRDDAIKLRDVLFLCHPKPENEEQAVTWKKLVDGELEPPDTWEVALSAGQDKKLTWERLLDEKKLGALAFLRNLRNMNSAGVDENKIFSALESIRVERILPFRFVSAARYAPQWESKLEKAMMKCLEGHEKLPGCTILIIDVSGSMNSLISRKSEMTRMDAACGLAILARELCEKVLIFSFSDQTLRIPDRHGFALRDAIANSQPHSSTKLGEAVTRCNQIAAERMIVITDEQSHDKVPAPYRTGYIINVASYQNGVGYGSWNHIDGWSEAVLEYISVVEK